VQPEPGDTETFVFVVPGPDDPVNAMIQPIDESVIDGARQFEVFDTSNRGLSASEVALLRFGEIP